MPDYVTWQRQQDICEDDFTPADKTAVLSMAVATEGEESARIVSYWLSRQPAAFRVYRKADGGEPVGFMAWLQLTDPEDDDARADPVVAAAWEHSRSARPIRSGEYLAVARFAVNVIAYQRPSPVTDLVQMRILAEWLRADRLAWSYLVVADAQFWRPQMDYLDQHLIPAMPTVGGRRYALYVHDWREVPVETWLDRHVEQELFGPRSHPPSPAAGLAVLSRDEFHTAVRGALRSWRRNDQLATNPLTRTRLAADSGPEPVTALRQALSEAASTLAQDPRTEHLHRVIDTTFFLGTPTQESAAERLSLPLSTYRRHLARGLDDICNVLWSRELYGTAG